MGMVRAVMRAWVRAVGGAMVDTGVAIARARVRALLRPWVDASVWDMRWWWGSVIGWGSRTSGVIGLTWDTRDTRKYSWVYTGWIYWIGAGV